MIAVGSMHDSHVEERHAHYGEDLKCTHPNCGATFGCHSFLATHEISPHKENNVQMLISRLPKHFSHRKRLAKSWKKHAGERPHRCCFENCGKTFAQSSTLVIHFKSHTGKNHLASKRSARCSLSSPSAI